MISDRFKCIFVHIPKCGGTSIEAVIWPGRRTSDELWMGFIDRHHNKYQTDGLQHLLAEQIRKEVGGRRFDEYFKFTFVRNPFDKLVSQFLFMQIRGPLREFIGMERSDSFSHYIQLIQNRSHAQWEHQSAFIYDAAGNLLVDFVGRFESLSEDCDHIFGRLGIQCSNLPHLNANVRQHYRAYYSEHDRRIVENLYAKDFELFGYDW